MGATGAWVERSSGDCDDSGKSKTDIAVAIYSYICQSDYFSHLKRFIFSPLILDDKFATVQVPMKEETE
jgi:hypothetical protein